MSWIQLLCIGFNLCIYQSKLEAKAKSYFPSSLLCPTCLNQWYRNPCIVHCFLLSTVKRVFIESAQLCLLLIINWCIEWMNETDTIDFLCDFSCLEISTRCIFQWRCHLCAQILNQVLQEFIHVSLSKPTKADIFISGFYYLYCSGFKIW